MDGWMDGWMDSLGPTPKFLRPAAAARWPQRPTSLRGRAKIAWQFVRFSVQGYGVVHQFREWFLLLAFVGHLNDKSFGTVLRDV